MNTFLAVATNEVRLLWRRRSFWVVQGFLLFPQGLVLFLYLRRLISGPNNALSGPLYNYSWESGVPGIVTLAIIYLVVPLLLVPVALRDLKETGELLWNGPLDPDVHLLGVFSGLWLGLLSGALLQLAAWGLVAALWTSLVPAWAWLYGLLIFLAANTLMLGLVFLLAALLRRTLPALIAWAVLWAWTWWQVVFKEGIIEGYFPLHKTALWNPFFHNLRLSPSLGLGLSGELAWGMLAWFTGIGLAAFALAGLVLRYADPRRSPRRAWLWPALSLVPVVVAATGFLLIGRGQAAHADPISPYDPQIDTWQVLSQVTTLDVDATEGQVAGDSTLVLAPFETPQRAEVVLRLNQGLEVTAARDGAGAGLLVQRAGDSVVIGLPALPKGDLTLKLAWQGRLQLPFRAFAQDWHFADGPDDVHYMYMPLPLGGLLEPEMGYLLRDGDWQPWPWSSLPHQAEQSRLELRLVGASFLSPAPVTENFLVLEGPLPEALMAYVNDPRAAVQPPVVAARRVGSYHLQAADLIAAAAGQAAPRLGQEAPRSVVVMPYLSDLAWSGDLLLLPDGGEPYLADSIGWVYFLGLSQANRAAMERTALWAVLREWLVERDDPIPRPFQSVAQVKVASQVDPYVGSIPEAEWDTKKGLWLQSPSVFDLYTMWDPRRRVMLTTVGRDSALAFWLAMELSPEAVRQGDLELIGYLLDVEGASLGGSARYGLTSARAWPGVLDSKPASRWVVDLDAWAEAAGREQALEQVFGLLRSSWMGGTPQGELGAFWEALEQTTGVSLPGALR